MLGGALHIESTHINKIKKDENGEEEAADETHLKSPNWIKYRAKLSAAFLNSPPARHPPTSCRAFLKAFRLVFLSIFFHSVFVCVAVFVFWFFLAVYHIAVCTIKSTGSIATTTANVQRQFGTQFRIRIKKDIFNFNQSPASQQNHCIRLANRRGNVNTGVNGLSLSLIVKHLAICENQTKLKHKL